MRILQYFKSLADETRLRLINMLQFNEFSVNEIVALMGMGQSRVSRHLKILTEAGLLTCRRDGVWAFYRTKTEGNGKLLVDSLRFLLEQESILQQDLSRAALLVEDRKSRSLQFFNTIASDWDLLKREILGSFDLNQVLLNQIPSQGSIADLGCGTGDFLASIADGSRMVIGVDSSAKMLDQTRKRFPLGNGSPELRLGEMEHLPLKDNEVDCAVVSMVLHHISNPGAAINEAFRILSPGGRLIIADLDKHNNESMRTRYGDRWLGFSRPEIETSLSESGFTLKNVAKHNIGRSLSINVFRAEKAPAALGTLAKRSFPV